MKKKRPLIAPQISPVKRWFFAVSAAVSISSTILADIPDQPPGRLSGVYKVATSTDPIFPATRQREYFLDFGQGVRAGKTSGNVAVSMRQNPNVKVRVMAWEYFAGQGKILIGNPFAEGSNRALAKGVWQMKPILNGVLFERGSYRVVLHTADPNDY